MMHSELETLWLRVAGASEPSEVPSEAGSDSLHACPHSLHACPQTSEPGSYSVLRCATGCQQGHIRVDSRKSSVRVTLPWTKIPPPLPSTLLSQAPPRSLRPSEETRRRCCTVTNYDSMSVLGCNASVAWPTGGGGGLQIKSRGRG